MFIAAGGAPNQLLVDNGNLYWTNASLGSAVKSAQLANPSVQTTIANRQDHTWAIHVAGGYVFWSVNTQQYSGTNRGPIRYTPLNAGQPVDVADGGSPLELFTNVATTSMVSYQDKLFWNDLNLGSTQLKQWTIDTSPTGIVERDTLGGSPASLLVEGANLFVGTSLADLERFPVDINRDGGAIVSNTSENGMVRCMATDGAYVYFASEQDFLFRHEIATGNTVLMASPAGSTLADAPLSMVYHQGFLYYTTANVSLGAPFGVFRLSVAATSTADGGVTFAAPEALVTPNSTTKRGIAAFGNFIYWAEGPNIMGLRPVGL